MLNNPIRFSDPSGHGDSGECGPGEDCDKKERKPYSPPQVPESQDETCAIGEECYDEQNLPIGIGSAYTHTEEIYDSHLIKYGTTSSEYINTPSPNAFYFSNTNSSPSGYEVNTEYIFGGLDLADDKYTIGFRTPGLGGKENPNHMAMSASIDYGDNPLFSEMDRELTISMYPSDVIDTNQRTEVMTGTYVTIRDKELEVLYASIVLVSYIAGPAIETLCGSGACPIPVGP